MDECYFHTSLNGSCFTQSQCGTNATPQHDKGFLDRWRWEEFLKIGRSAKKKKKNTHKFPSSDAHNMDLPGRVSALRKGKTRKLEATHRLQAWIISFLYPNYKLSFTALLLDANKQLSRGHQEDLGHKVWKRLLRLRLLYPSPGPPNFCNLSYKASL